MAALPYLDIGLEELNANTSFSTDKYASSYLFSFIMFRSLSLLLFLPLTLSTLDKALQACLAPTTHIVLWTMLQKRSGKFERYLASTVLIIWYSFLFSPLSLLVLFFASSFFLLLFEREVQILIFFLQLSLTSQYTLSELPTPGKSGSFFYYSNDRKFMLKTISATEFDNFLQMLPNYFLVCFCFFSSSSSSSSSSVLLDGTR